MLFTSIETAQLLEEADIIHITRQVQACVQLFPDHNILAPQTIGGGVVAITVPSFGSKLNKVVGFGMSGPVSASNLIEIESLFAREGIQTNIALCPYADPTALNVLVERGYGISGFINNYAKLLTDEDAEEDLKENVNGLEVFKIEDGKSEEFVKASFEGYKDNGRSELLLKTLARMAVLRADTWIYFATIEGKVAGSAGLALIETSGGKVAHLYIDSTLPEYRGEGVQTALFRERLKDARKAGYEVASVATRPGTGSSRNIESAGFRLAVTKPNLSKELSL
jgi:GNAT superfamily N-acetyltransferase